MLLAAVRAQGENKGETLVRAFSNDAALHTVLSGGGKPHQAFRHKRLSSLQMTAQSRPGRGRQVGRFI